MNLGKKIGVSAMTLGLSFGALALGAAGCGSTKAETKGTAETDGSEKKTTMPTGNETTPGAEKKDPAGGEHSCGAGSCGKLYLDRK
ncbi:MAG: hypothetical protein U1F43_32690 [Myxococcota bacterium]